jgi:hypothetical protein
MKMFITPLNKLLLWPLLLLIPVVAGAQNNELWERAEQEIWHKLVKQVHSPHLRHDFEYQLRVDDIYSQTAIHAFRLDNRLQQTNPLSFGAGYFYNPNDRNEFRPHIYHHFEQHREVIEVRNALEHRSYNWGDDQFRYRLRTYLNLIYKERLRLFLTDEIMFHLNRGREGVAGISEHRYGFLLEWKQDSYQLNLELFRADVYSFMKAQHIIAQLSLIFF